MALLGHLLAGLAVAQGEVRAPATGTCDPFLQGAPDLPGLAQCLQTGCGRLLSDRAGRRLAGLERSLGADPWLEMALGWYLRDSDRTAAEVHLLRAIAAPVDEVRARASLELGRLLRRAGKPAEAVFHTERAIALAEELGDQALHADALRERADVHIAQDQLSQARFVLAGVEPVVRSGEACGVEDRWLRSSNQAAYELERYGESIALAREGLELAQRAGDLEAMAIARYNLAIRLVEEPPRPGLREELREELEETARLARLVNHQAVLTRSLRLLAQLYPGEEGLLRGKECLRLAADDPCFRARCLRALARNRLAESPSEAATRLASATETGCEGSLDIRLSWPARLHVGWATRPREALIADFELVLDQLERHRDVQTADGSRVRAFSRWADAFHNFAGYLLRADGEEPDRSSVERAFDLGERVRGRALIESLLRARGRASEADPELLARRQTALEGITRIQRELLDGAQTVEERERSLRELSRLEEAAATLRGLQEERDEVTSAPARVSLDEVEALLGPREAMLVFQVGQLENLYGEFGGGSWLLAVTSQGTRVTAISEGSEIQVASDLLEGLVERRAEIATPAAALYRKLLAKGIAGLPEGIEHLLVAPDGPVFELPIAALLEHGSERPFLQSTIPSATLWALWRRDRAPRADEGVLVFADPALPARSGAQGATRGGRSSAFAQTESLGRLPHARAEARSIRRHVGRAVEVLEDEDASESRLKAMESIPNVLHFAAHALVDYDSPERSGVLLAPGAESEDGVLQAREITELDLDGAMVVLSACRTASGEVLRGEGVMSLARSFFQAGASTVVSSLWPLHDDHAAVAFGAFYRHLARGLPVAAALAEAQQELARAGYPEVAWAGLVVFGDGALTPLSPRAPYTAVAASGLLILALVLLLAPRKSR